MKQTRAVICTMCYSCITFASLGAPITTCLPTSSLKMYMCTNLRVLQAWTDPTNTSKTQPAKTFRHSLKCTLQQGSCHKTPFRTLGSHQISADEMRSFLGWGTNWNVECLHDWQPQPTHRGVHRNAHSCLPSSTCIPARTSCHGRSCERHSAAHHDLPKLVILCLEPNRPEHTCACWDRPGTMAKPSNQHTMQPTCTRLIVSTTGSQEKTKAQTPLVASWFTGRSTRLHQTVGLRTKQKPRKGQSQGRRKHGNRSARCPTLSHLCLFST